MGLPGVWADGMAIADWKEGCGNIGEGWVKLKAIKETLKQTMVKKNDSHLLSKRED